MNRLVYGLLIVLCFDVYLQPHAAKGDLFINFVSNSAFGGDGAADTAGPFAVTDSSNMNPVATTFTTQAVNTGSLSSTGIGLGVDGGNRNDEFDANPSTLGAAGESWTFQLDQTVRLLDVRYSSLQDNEFFDMRSSAWIGLGYTPTNGSVTFNNATGTFSFTSDPDDAFNLTDMTNGAALSYVSGTNVTFEFRSTDVSFGLSDHATILGMTLSAPASVPEPTAFWLTGLVLLGCGFLAGKNRLERLVAR